MTKTTGIARVTTGVRNLDKLLGGGVPKGSVIVLAGAPGSGKTIFAQQFAFQNAAAGSRSVYFSTLSEPTAKTLLYLRDFSFFDPQKMKHEVQFVDLGGLLRTKGLEQAISQIIQHVKRAKPSFVVIDSFKVFDDLARSREDMRRFSYELIVNLMAWEVTAFLVGEYGKAEYETNSLFSISDGLFVLSQRESMGENQRFFKAIKLRGTRHSRDEHPLIISPNGIEVFAARVGLDRQSPPAPHSAGSTARCRTNIPKLDALLGAGIPWGSSLLISGVAGTGKTVLSLEFIYRGALMGERGILFSFEETEERLLATGSGLGWDLEREIKRGMIKIIFIPQPDIRVESHLLMMREEIESMKAKRVVIDSVSVFLHKISEPQITREKVFDLCTIIHNADAVGFFPTDIPYGTQQVSRFGVEETVVDGVIILSATEETLDRQRYIEVYKLRNTAHLKGRHILVIEKGGVSVYPRYNVDPLIEGPPPALVADPRLKSGTPGLDALLGGGFLQRSVTILSGSAGIGKSTLALQFILEGARAKQPGLYVTLEEGPEQLLASARALKLPLQAEIARGLIDILYVPREHLRAGQFLSVLADRLQQLKARRLIFDSPLHLISERMGLDEFRQILYKLVARFKALDVTTLLTVESSAGSADYGTELNISPIADNLITLRYKETEGQLLPLLTVVKTRGSAHSRRTHPITIGEGGLRLAAAPGEAAPPAATRGHAPRQRPRKRGSQAG